MNSLLEIGIVAAAVILAAAFVVLRVLKTLRGKRPSCCAGGDGKPAKRAACPHCAAEGSTQGLSSAKN
jgi:hypothetical protein